MSFGSVPGAQLLHALSQHFAKTTRAAADVVSLFAKLAESCDFVLVPFARHSLSQCRNQTSGV